MSRAPFPYVLLCGQFVSLCAELGFPLLPSFIVQVPPPFFEKNGRLWGPPKYQVFSLLTVFPPTTFLAVRAFASPFLGPKAIPASPFSAMHGFAEFSALFHACFRLQELHVRFFPWAAPSFFLFFLVWFVLVVFFPDPPPGEVWSAVIQGDALFVPKSLCR